jgi:hypothetical protein
MSEVMINHGFWKWFAHDKTCYFPTYDEFIKFYTTDLQNEREDKWRLLIRLMFIEFEFKYLIVMYCYLWCLFVDKRVGKPDTTILKRLYQHERKKQSHVCFNPLFTQDIQILVK